MATARGDKRDLQITQRQLEGELDTYYVRCSVAHSGGQDLTTRGLIARPGRRPVAAAAWQTELEDLKAERTVMLNQIESLKSSNAELERQLRELDATHAEEVAQLQAQEAELTTKLEQMTHERDVEERRAMESETAVRQLQVRATVEGARPGARSPGPLTHCAFRRWRGGGMGQVALDAAQAHSATLTERVTKLLEDRKKDDQLAASWQAERAELEGRCARLEKDVVDRDRRLLEARNVVERQRLVGALRGTHRGPAHFARCPHAHPWPMLALPCRAQAKEQEMANKTKLMTEQLQEKDRALERLQARNTELELELKQANVDLTQAQLEAADLRSKVTMLEDDLSQAKTSEKDAESLKQQLLERLQATEIEQTAALDLRLVSAEKRAEEEHARRQQLQAELSVAQAELETAQQAAAQRQKELERLRADHADEIAALSAERDRQVAEAQERTEEAERAVAEKAALVQKLHDAIGTVHPSRGCQTCAALSAY